MSNRSHVNQSSATLLPVSSVSRTATDLNLAVDGRNYEAHFVSDTVILSFLKQGNLLCNLCKLRELGQGAPDSCSNQDIWHHAGAEEERGSESSKSQKRIGV